MSAQRVWGPPAASRFKSWLASDGGGDMARCGELWRDMGRYGEMWRDVARYGEMLGDVGRYGEMWGDVGRCGELFLKSQPASGCG